MHRNAFVPLPDVFYERRETNRKHDMHYPHYHDTYEIYLQTHGERYLFLNGICHALKPMDLYIVKPFELHYTQSMSSNYYGRYVLNFEDENFKTLLTSSERRLLMSKISTGLYHLDQEHFDRMCNIFNELKLCWNKNSFLSSKLKYSCILQILLLIRECHQMEFFKLEGDSDIKPEIQAAINYINKHYREPLTLDDVTNHIDMSKYHFCRLFKTAVDSTFVEYLNGIRISKAHQMLLETNLSITDIAKETGFSSGLHLTRVFKSNYHISPTEFRKQYKEESDNLDQT